MRTRVACQALMAASLTIVRAAPGQAPARATAPDSSWVARSALYEVFVQDFSPQGTFRGVLAGLERIQSSGANVVWLMPVHPIGVAGRKGTLGSPYAARDFRAINPAYGTAADLHALIRAIHARGMKVILDWVPDHTSLDHPWVKAHPDFYVKNERGEPSVPRDPKGKLTDWTDVLQLDYANPGLRREMIATMRYWLEDFGLDGFRVDVAGFLPVDFWRQAVPALRAAVPRPILLLAEWDDLELHRAGFDLTYGWDSYKRLKAVWGGAPASTFVQGELPDIQAMPPGGMRMRFTTNHDETAWDDPPLKIFGGSAQARAAYLAVALLPGRPLLYNGQDVESPQKLALFEPVPIEWRQPNARSAQAFYRQVLRLARTEPSFTKGDLAAVETSAPDDVIAYRRDQTVVLVNPRSKAVRFAVNGARVDGTRDLLSNRIQRGDTVALPAYGTMVLKGAARQLGEARGVVKQARPFGDEVFYQIFVRSFRDSDGDRVGDLRGIEDKLEYLQDLGVTSILLTPINPSPFYHNYFASSFEAVDSAFGGMGAYRALVRSIHARGMKLYLDQEIQYTAEDHPWLRQSLGQPASEYSHFVLYNGPGNTRPESGVFGLTVVPSYNGQKINIATVNLLDSLTQRYFQRLFVSLIDPDHDGRFDDGVDGFRIDHMMDDLDMKGKLTNLFGRFWAPVFAAARAANPRIKIIAEQFDWGFGEDFLTRGGADLVFAFPLRNAIKSLNRQAIADTMAQTWKRTPPGKGQLLFIENHDMNRFASEMGGDVRKEKIGAALNILLQGTPLIYYGQEIGMRGRQNKTWGTDANDIPVREAFEWSRKGDGPGAANWYRGTGPWWTDRYARDDDGLSVEEEQGDSSSLLSFYRRLLTLRRSRPELASGDERVVSTDRADVLAVVRATTGHASLLLVNLSDSATIVTVSRGTAPEVLRKAPVSELLSGGSQAAAGGVLRVSLAPFGVKLLTP
ncbi:MAG: alpha-amylase family glycosyl hydrolase [Gemmatimonadales bacterium]